MRNFSLAVAVLLASATVARAADPAIYAPVYEPAPQKAPPPKFSWERCYAGVQIGQKDVHARTDASNTDFFDAKFISKATTNLMGPVAGGQIGCNFEFADSLVIGFELEGLYGDKDQRNCQTQTDPVSYCLDFKKKYEGFLTGRIGYAFGGSDNLGLGGTLVYSRFGVGYTQTDLKMNVNSISYISVIDSFWGTDVSRPAWAQNFDLSGRKSFVSPVLGVGVEHAVDQNWTIRADFSAMFSGRSSLSPTVDKFTFVNGNPGDQLPADLSQVKRNVKLGDVIPMKIREAETRFTLGLNRLF